MKREWFRVLSDPGMTLYELKSYELTTFEMQHVTELLDIGSVSNRITLTSNI